LKHNIIFATGNKGKMKEIREILGGFATTLLSMKEAGIDIEIIEDGDTFEENAMIKAKAVASHLTEDKKDWIVLADDSGLEIDALNQEPGVYSARYGGEDLPYADKMNMLLERLEKVPEEERTARFVAAIAAVLPDGECLSVRGTIEGVIGDAPIGGNGFGYDPIFYVPAYGCTTAQMDSKQKNLLSHRGKALRAMKEELENYDENINRQ
jgi:XTP/dITP diphosphohydrolase